MSDQWIPENDQIVLTPMGKAKVVSVTRAHVIGAQELIMVETLPLGHAHRALGPDEDAHPTHFWRSDEVRGLNPQGPELPPQLVPSFVRQVEVSSPAPFRVDHDHDWILTEMRGAEATLTCQICSDTREVAVRLRNSAKERP